MSLWSLLILAAFVSSTLLLFVAAWRLGRERCRLRRMGEEYCRVLAEKGIALWEE